MKFIRIPGKSSWFPSFRLDPQWGGWSIIWGFIRVPSAILVWDFPCNHPYGFPMERAFETSKNVSKMDGLFHGRSHENGMRTIGLPLLFEETSIYLPWNRLKWLMLWTNGNWYMVLSTNHHDFHLSPLIPWFQETSISSHIIPYHSTSSHIIIIPHHPIFYIHLSHIIPYQTHPHGTAMTVTESPLRCPTLLGPSEPRGRVRLMALAILLVGGQLGHPVLKNMNVHLMIINFIWLVVWTPLKNDGVRPLGW